MSIVQEHYPGTSKMQAWQEAGSSQSFVKGELVYINSSGQVAACAADPDLIWGVANEDASGTQATMIDVLVIQPGSIWRMDSSTTTALAHEGQGYGVTVASNSWTVDIADTLRPRVKVYKLDPREAVGTSGGGYLVQFIPEYLQASAGLQLSATATWDAGSLANAAAEQKDVTVTGAALGDFAIASMGVDTQGIALDAQVTATNTVTVTLSNMASGTIDLASTTVKVKVFKS